MDPLTHGALGAMVAGLIPGGKDDPRLPACGALAGTLPDIDIIPTLFLGPLSQLDLHRGLTHTILFAIVISPLIGFMIHRFLNKKKVDDRFMTWTLILFLGILSHILLDCFTSYGTRIFLPFSNYRVAWGTLAVVDPFFSIPVAVAALSLFLTRQNEKLRRRLFAAGLSIGIAYLSATVFNKVHSDAVFRRSLKKQNLEFTRLMTTPMPFSNLLWVGIAEGGEFFYTGYYSMLDRDDSISFQRDRKNHDYLKNLGGYSQIQKLISFAKDFYIIDSKHGMLVFNDLRYGSIAAGGGEKEFIFSYIIKNNRGRLDIIRNGRSRMTPDSLDTVIQAHCRQKVAFSS